MRLSFNDAVVSKDIYDIEGEVTLKRVSWKHLPNTESLEDDDIDIFADTAEGKRARRAERKAEDNVRENVFRMLSALGRRMETSSESVISPVAVADVVRSLTERVSLKEGIRVLARNIGKPRVRSIASLCSADKGHKFYRDVTLEEIMLVGLLENPERAYNVSSDARYRKAWRVYFNLSTLEAGVVYYFSRDRYFPGFTPRGLQTLRVPFRSEIQEEFRKFGLAVRKGAVDYKRYLGDSVDRGHGDFTYVTSHGVADSRGLIKLRGKRVSKAKWKKKHVFFGNELGKMLWYDDLSRLVVYLESIPSVFLDDREFNGYGFFFDDHFLIYDDRGRLVEKVKAKKSYNAAFQRTTERHGNGRDDLADYRREIREENAMLGPLLSLINHIEGEAREASDRGELTPKERYIRQIREELGIDLSASFRRPEDMGLGKSVVVHFDPPLGYRFPEMYRAFHLILSHVPQNLRRFAQGLMTERVVDYLFSEFEVDGTDPAHPKHCYLRPAKEQFWPARKASSTWETRLSEKSGWLKEKYDDAAMMGYVVIDEITLWAVFQKADRERYIPSILAEIFEKMWPFYISRPVKRRYFGALVRYPKLYDELLTTRLVISQTSSSWEKDEDLLLSNASDSGHAYNFGDLFALYILDPARIDEYPEIKRFFDWLCRQKFSVARRGKKDE